MNIGLLFKFNRRYLLREVYNMIKDACLRRVCFLLDDEEVLSLTFSPEAESCSSLSTAIASRDKRARSSRNYSCSWRFSLPRWVTSQVLEVAGVKAPGGWNWYLRPYSVVSCYSETISFVRDGNVQGLQRLFASGQASPFDRSDHPAGTTLPLLHVSILDGYQKPLLSETLTDNQGGRPRK